MMEGLAKYAPIILTRGLDKERLSLMLDDGTLSTGDRALCLSAYNRILDTEWLIDEIHRRAEDQWEEQGGND